MINVDCSAYSTKIFGGISEKLLTLLKLLTRTDYTKYAAFTASDQKSNFAHTYN